MPSRARHHTRHTTSVLSSTPEASFILGDDGNSQWESLGPDWAEFLSFWSEAKDHLPNRLYPHVLDLHLPDAIQNIVFPLEDLSNKILVTQSYADLYERIKSGFQLAEVKKVGTRLTRPVVARKGAIITGQPGTGTLYFYFSMNGYLL